MQQLIQYVEQLVPRGMDFILSLAIGIIVFFVGSKLIKKLLKIVRRSMEKREMESGVISFFLSAGKIALYVLLIIIVAQIFGFAASSIVAIVGSAGLAIGLALQGSLANFAGGVLILIMKPFCVGDYIIVGDVEGVVQKIDVVYTTLTTADNRAVILPNGKLADSNIVNATKEDRRRVDISVGIAYDAPLNLAKEVLMKIGESQKDRLPDEPIRVVVSELGDSAVILLIQLWVKPEDYWTTRWTMTEQIKKSFDEAGISIPFPQMDVHMVSTKGN